MGVGISEYSLIFLKGHNLGKYARRMNETTAGLIYSNYGLCKEPIIYMEKIPLKDIFATQTGRYSEKQLKATEAGEACFPVLVGTFKRDEKMKYWLMDGHHRVEWYLINGHEKIPALVLNTDKKPTGLCYPFEKFLQQPLQEGGGSDSPYSMYQYL